MKVGDLVRFQDISSGAASGDGMFAALHGQVGLVISLSACLSGNPMATVRFSRTHAPLIAGLERGRRDQTFNRLYFEASDESR